MSREVSGYQIELKPITERTVTYRATKDGNKYACKRIKKDDVHLIAACKLMMKIKHDNIIVQK